MKSDSEMARAANTRYVCFLTAFEIYYDEFKRMFPKLHVRCFARKPVTASDLKKIIMYEMEAPPIPFK
jgi:hypothetical protein